MAKRGSLTSDIKQWYVKNFQGQNTKIEENELDNTHGTIAQNCRFEGEPGSLIKRDVLRYYNATEMASTSYVHSSYRFYTTGTEKLIIAAELTNNTTSLRIGDDANGTFTDIKTGLSSGKRFTFVAYKNLCYMSNGTDNILVNDASSDNVCWELGSCKAVDSGTAGNLNGAYYYAITMTADAYVCGAVSNTVTVVTNKMTLSNIPLGPAGTTNRKIYRTAAGGSTLKLVATISDNTTTDYTDNIADGSLGATMPAVTDDMPVGKELRIHRERLFVSQNPNYPSNIYYSDPYLPWYIRQTTNTDYMEISPNDGDEIAGVPIQLSVMCCIKKNTIRKVHITTPVSGASPATWYADDPISFDGCPAPKTIVQTPYGIVYLGWNHWHLFNGANSTPIIDEFDTAEILEARYSDTIAYWHNGILMWGYTDQATGEQYHNRIARYNWKRKALSVDTTNGNAFAAAVGDDESGELYIGDANAGYVYKDVATQWIKIRTKSELSAATLDDIYVGGDENDPWFEIGWTVDKDNAVGTIDSGYPGATINMPDTTGNIIFPSQNIQASTLGKIYWNQRKFHTSDTIAVQTRTGATQAACEAASWSASLTDPSGSSIASTANEWFQMRVVLTANSMAGSPRVYYSDGYVIKYNYTRGGAEAESAVEFIFDTGYRNFDKPFVDKIFKKIASVHEGTVGTVTLYWYTENANGSFTIDLTNNPQRWDSFFQSTAMGKKLRLVIYKNDLEDFKVNEYKGLWTPEPIIV